MYFYAKFALRFAPARLYRKKQKTCITHTIAAARGMSKRVKRPFCAAGLKDQLAHLPGRGAGGGGRKELTLKRRREEYPHGVGQTGTTRPEFEEPFSNLSFV